MSWNPREQVLGLAWTEQGRVTELVAVGGEGWLLRTDAEHGIPPRELSTAPHQNLNQNSWQQCLSGRQGMGRDELDLTAEECQWVDAAWL